MKIAITKETPPWQKAQLLRRLAMSAKSRSTALKLYAQVRYYEAQAFKEGTAPVSALRHTKQSKDQAETDSHQVPLWFKQLKSKLKCINCGAHQGAYWYDKETQIRMRMMPAVKKNNVDRVKVLISQSVILCRTCKEIPHEG